MKRILFGSVAIFVLTAAFCRCHANEENAKEKPVAQKPAEKAKEFLSESYTDPETKKVYRWIGEFRLDDSPAARMKAKLKGKAAYRITGALYEIKMIGSREVRSRQSGTCWVYIEDADGKEVARATKSLNTMCPS